MLKSHIIGCMILLEQRSHGSILSWECGSLHWVAGMHNSPDGYKTPNDQTLSGWLDSSTHRVSSHPWNKRWPGWIREVKDEVDMVEEGNKKLGHSTMWFSAQKSLKDPSIRFKTPNRLESTSRVCSLRQHSGPRTLWMNPQRRPCTHRYPCSTCLRRKWKRELVIWTSLRSIIALSTSTRKGLIFTRYAECISPVRAQEEANRIGRREELHFCAARTDLVDWYGIPAYAILVLLI